MSELTSPSVGSITQKILKIRPDLGARELIAIIRASTRAQGPEAGEFASIHVIDEARALELAGKFESVQ